LGDIEAKNFCLSKDISKKMKKQATQRKKVLVIHIPAKDSY
jgi:hypothetical protein